jgi:hypothetical protein
MRFVRFTDMHGDPVFVAGANVRIVEPQRDGTALIVFDDEHRMYVKENAEEVVTRLERA